MAATKKKPTKKAGSRKGTKYQGEWQPGSRGRPPKGVSKETGRYTR